MSDELELRLRLYCARYEWTIGRVADVLGITPNTLLLKRKGRREFTSKELFLLSELLDMSMVDLFDILPEVNHAEL